MFVINILLVNCTTEKYISLYNHDYYFITIVLCKTLLKYIFCFIHSYFLVIFVDIDDNSVFVVSNTECTRILDQVKKWPYLEQNGSIAIG